MRCARAADKTNVIRYRIGEDHTEVKSGITGVPGQENAFSIVTSSDPSVSGYLKAVKDTADNVGLEYPDTKSFFKYGSGSFAISYWGSLTSAASTPISQALCAASARAGSSSS